MTSELGRCVEPAPEFGIARLGRCLRRLSRLATEPWRRREAMRELRRLNTRALRDAGIERSEIESVVDDMLAARRRIE
jgi:uncharacterized protein YjiS (DUF1127 family)